MSGTVYTIYPEMYDGFSSSNIHVFTDDEGLAIVDAGCGSAGAVKNTVEGFSSHGLSITDVHTVLLTHAHVDHACGLAPLIELGMSPERVWIHRLERESTRDLARLQRYFDFEWLANQYPQILLENPEVLLGIKHHIFHDHCPWRPTAITDVFGDYEVVHAGGFRFLAVPCRGHSVGHTAFFEQTTNTLLTGDHVGPSIAWHAPAAGGVTAYLEGLDNLAALPAGRLLPAHGPEPDDPAATIASIRERILYKERKILEALGGGAMNFEQLRAAYSGDNAGMRLFPTAAMLEGHLLKLESEDAVSRDGDVIRLTET